MSVNKKSLIMAAALAVLAAGTSVFADIEYKPYGAAHYRLREQINIGNGADESSVIALYSNWFAWRAGVRVKANDQLSLQFQIGNDWGYSEQVNWINNNNSPADQSSHIRAPFQNLYVHIASFKWDAGPLFLEGGVVNVPAGNGSLDLLERSIFNNSYNNAAFFGWGIANASLLGIRAGVPIIKDGSVKVRAELLQSVINTRSPSFNFAGDALSNPSSPLFVFNVPVEAGALTVTPELVAVVNRNFNQATESGDHEIIGGLGAGYQVNQNIKVTAHGSYGTVSNKNSRVGTYNTIYSNSNVSGSIPANDSSEAPVYTSNGLQVGAGATVKAGPGSIFFDFKYNSAENAEIEGSKVNFIHTLIQYSWKPNPNFAIIPRYRNFYTINPEGSAIESQINNRFELIFEGSF
jgi:hypothetical protein